MEECKKILEYFLSRLIKDEQKVDVAVHDPGKTSIYVKNVRINKYFSTIYETKFSIEELGFISIKSMEIMNIRIASSTKRLHTLEIFKEALEEQIQKSESKIVEVYFEKENKQPLLIISYQRKS